MGNLCQKWELSSFLLFTVLFYTLSSQAKLAHTIDNHFTEKTLQNFVFKKNQKKFSLRREARWLQKNYRSKADQAYILRQYKKIKYSFKPILFFYKDHLELRVNGRLMARMTDIDSLNKTLKVNSQDVTFKKGQTLAQIHHRMIVAMSTKISWNPLDLFIPRAHAFMSSDLLSSVALFFMVRTAKQAQAQTNEGAMVSAAARFCKDPGATVSGVTRAAQVMITRVYKFSQETDANRDVCIRRGARVTYSDCSCIGRAYITKYGYNPQQQPRAEQLCSAGISARNQCEARQREEASPQSPSSPSTDSTTAM